MYAVLEDSKPYLNSFCHFDIPYQQGRDSLWLPYFMYCVDNVIQCNVLLKLHAGPTRLCTAQEES